VPSSIKTWHNFLNIHLNSNTEKFKTTIHNSSFVLYSFIVMEKILLIDADDTLWENFQYFEQGRKIFLNHMNVYGFEISAVDNHLKKMDSERVHEFGFGSMGYKMAMERTVKYFLKQQNREYSKEDEKILNEIRELVANHEIVPYDGVDETLSYLHEKYPLFVVTKGVFQEQSNKVERSGLKKYFKDVIVIPDKQISDYEKIIKNMHLDKEITWMIGNSPKSDINPPSAIGLGAVYVHQEESWDFEHEELKTNGRFHHLQEFKQLRDIF